MKKALTITALAAFSLIGSTAIGQSLNIKGGFTSSTIKSEYMTNSNSTQEYGGTTYTQSYNYKSVGGFNASIAYEFRLGERLSLETGLKYQTRGFKEESEFIYTDELYNERENSVFEFKMNYVDVPIVMNVAILKGDVRVYTRAGVYAGIMTIGKFNVESEYTSSDGDSGGYEFSETVMGGDFEEERFTGGLIFGAGVEYKSIYFETNYSIGAMSLASIYDKTYYHDLSLSLGYKFKFKK